MAWKYRNLSAINESLKERFNCQPIKQHLSEGKPQVLNRIKQNFKKVKKDIKRNQNQGKDSMSNIRSICYMQVIK